MDAERWSLIETLFAELVELGPGPRSDFLDRACGSDPALRRELEAMLAADAPDRQLRMESRLVVDERGASGDDGEPAEDPLVGRRFGAYRLLRRIGAGGMASVYLAERDDEQFRQQVAIKVLGLGLSGAEAIARFRVERQILADLVHPHIARLLDGGVSPEGQLYIVMEYVDGQPITAYADEQRLTIPDRLRLLARACLAVQHAHQNLVVHRDLKPSNILVSREGEVKLLDFGIAKLLDPDAAGAAAIRTREDVRVMTLEYASPEQIAGGPITTATDVHALGVLLYELLTGHRPHEAGESRSDLERRVSTEMPPLPSLMVRRTTRRQAGRAAEIQEVAARRRATPERLARELDGDLDKIVSMALRKEPQRRYASAGQLAEDLDRYLAGQPVIAERDRVTYRARKFVGRHRWSVGAGAAVGVTLIAFSLVTALQAQRLTVERDSVQRERDRAEQVLSVLIDVFRLSDPSVTPAQSSPDLAAFLQQAENRTARELDGQPAIQARLEHVLGKIYAARSEYAKARTLQERALARQVSLAGADDPLAAEMFHDLAVLVGHLGETARARDLLAESVARHRRLYGEAHERLATTLQALANVTTATDERGRLLQEALDMRRRVLPSDHAAIAASLRALSTHDADAGRLAEAEALGREAVAMFERTVGNRHPESMGAVTDLATIYNRMNDLAKAGDMYRRLLATQREVLGNESFSVAASLNNLGVNLATRGDYREAEEILAESFNVHIKIFGDSHWRTANTARNVGRVFELQRRFADALRWLDRAVAIQARAVGAEHEGTLHMRAQAALVLLRLGRVAEAERHLADVLPRLEAQAAVTTEGRLADVRLWLGRTLVEAGKAAAAEPHLRAALAYRERTFAKDHPRAAEAQCDLARSLVTSRPAEAQALLTACVPIYTKWGLADPVVAEGVRQALAGGPP